MDPAALGTLIIGLDHVRAEQSDESGRRSAATRQATKRRALRAALAGGLHNVANRLERPTTQAAPG